MKITHLLLLASFLQATFAIAQSTKKPLDHSVYDKWQSISSEAISKNGKWIVYSVTPQEGDATLVLTNRDTGKALEVPRGDEAVFTDDSKYTVFFIKPAHSEMRMAKIKKKKSEEMPKDSLAVVENATFSITKYGNVKSFLLPRHNSGVLAFQLYPPVEKSKKKEEQREEDAEKGAPGKKPEKGQAFSLVLLNLGDRTEHVFKEVNEYILSGNGKFLAFTRNTPAKDSLINAGAFIYSIQTAKQHTVDRGKGSYSNLVFDESGNQLAFTLEEAMKIPLVKSKSLWWYRAGADSAVMIAGNCAKGLRDGWEVSTDGKVEFSKEGKRLFFGTAPVVPTKDTTIVDFEVAKVDIWNYKDDYLQPVQLKNREKDLKRSYLAVIDLSKRDELVQLADEQIPDVIPGKKGDAGFALASTNFGHRIGTQWLGSAVRDIYIISLKDGSRQKIAEAVKGEPHLSPGANYVVWFNALDSGWHSYSIKDRWLRPLSKKLKVAFYDETNDVPDSPDPYGLSAFSEDDKYVLIYDRYDIWKIALDKDYAVNLTRQYGRKKNITFRYYDLEKSRADRKKEEEAVVKPGQTLYLDAFNNASKMEGWYKTGLNATEAPSILVMGPVSYSRPFAAGKIPILIYRKENYTMSPDLYVSSGFKEEKKLSSINPWQKDYVWGTAELFKWTTPKGHSSEGILYKPENFDPGQKYPLIVYFYEKVSEKLYNYVAPAPTPSRLNISYFVSNGYLVFTPDISYETGHPGRSAEEYINSGVEALKRYSWVNGSKIGIQGQSWGGYQVAHLITRTNMYAAAWAGAPVVNMFSAYGGIRWESGLSRQFQYEKTQSRIGATIWEKPELYIENSPLFHFPNVNTPVVIMANDADGAVPWYQGIEMFTALRRLNKPVWMLNYNNEAHNLVQRQNRKDIQRREQQFFDHFLKGAPMPVWLEKGVPATEKGRNWGFDLIPKELQ